MSQNLNEIVQNDPVRGMIWGPSGSGKTTAAGRMAEFEEFRPIYFLDWDRRITSLQATIDPKLWEFIHSDPYRDNAIPGEAFTQMVAKLERVAGEGYKTIVLDSMTFMMIGAMNRILGLANRPSNSVPQLQDYNALKSLVVDFITRLCSRQFNVIITCHEDTNKDEVTGRMFKAIDLVGKLSNTMPGYFNEFWHAEVIQLTGGGQQFMLRTRSDVTYASRTSYKLESVEPSHLIWSKIVAQRKATAARLQATPGITKLLNNK